MVPRFNVRSEPKLVLDETGSPQGERFERREA